MPRPPTATEQEVKDAMEAKGDWFVPMLISDLRETADKGSGVVDYCLPVLSLTLRLFVPAGKPSVVVDAVFHSSLKERSGINSEFKMFLIRTHAISSDPHLTIDDGLV